MNYFTKYVISTTLFALVFSNVQGQSVPGRDFVAENKLQELSIRYRMALLEDSKDSDVSEFKVNYSILCKEYKDSIIEAQAIHYSNLLFDQGKLEKSKSDIESSISDLRRIYKAQNDKVMKDTAVELISQANIILYRKYRNDMSTDEIDVLVNSIKESKFSDHHLSQIYEITAESDTNYEYIKNKLSFIQAKYPDIKPRRFSDNAEVKVESAKETTVIIDDEIEAEYHK